MTLTIANYTYKVTSASLVAMIINPERAWPSINGVLRSGLSWRLSIDVENEWIAFYHEFLQIPYLSRWTDLAGRTISWNEPINAITGEPNGGWYGGNLLSGHLAIFQSTLQFVELDKPNLRAKWEGKCEGGKSDEQWPFYIDSWLTFKGVEVYGWDINNNSLIQTLTHVLDLSDLERNLKYEPGEPLLVPRSTN